MRLERVFTTLIRDPTSGLGFSISGGKGADPWIEGSDAVYISKVAEGGPAAKDGKLLVGDKLVQINGVDVAEADHRDVRVSRGFVKGLPPLPYFEQRKLVGFLVPFKYNKTSIKEKDPCARLTSQIGGFLWQTRQN